MDESIKQKIPNAITLARLCLAVVLFAVVVAALVSPALADGAPVSGLARMALEEKSITVDGDSIVLG